MQKHVSFRLQKRNQSLHESLVVAPCLSHDFSVHCRLKLQCALQKAREPIRFSAPMCCISLSEKRALLLVSFLLTLYGTFVVVAIVWTLVWVAISHSRNVKKGNRTFFVATCIHIRQDQKSLSVCQLCFSFNIEQRKVGSPHKLQKDLVRTQ